VSGRRLSRISIEASIDVPDPEAFAAAAREWFARAPELLAPDVWEEAVRAEKVPFTGRPEPIWPDFDDFLDPIMLWGRIIVAPLRWHGMKVLQRRLTRKNLDWLNEELAHRPVSAMVTVLRVDANGIELPGEMTIGAGATLGRVGAPNELVPDGHLFAGHMPGGAPGEVPSDFGMDCEGYAAMARATASRGGVRYMFAGEDVMGWIAPTALPPSLGLHRIWELEPFPDLLGYSWITLCPPSAVARFGGASALASTEAFWAVEEMPGGSALLQMCERAEDYGISQAQRAFDVLAPALPPGIPKRPIDWPQEVPWLIVPEDAASKRGRAIS